jgi:hypothetical protein
MPLPGKRGNGIDGDHREYDAVDAAPPGERAPTVSMVADRAHLMLKVRTSGVNGTFNSNPAIAERWAGRPFHRAA